MKRFYRTPDYIRDGFPLLDQIIILLSHLHPRVKRSLKKTLDIEIENYLFRIVENLPYAIMIFFLGTLFVFTLFKLSEEKNGLRIATITTTSMLPSIAPGSVIVTSPQLKYRKGEIITFKEKSAKTGFETGRILTHRIIEFKKESETSYLTKGDGNEIPDPSFVEKSQVLGKVVAVIPFIGYFELTLKTLPGFLIFITIPAIILVKNEVNYIKGLVKRETNFEDR